MFKKYDISKNRRTIHEKTHSFVNGCGLLVGSKIGLGFGYGLAGGFGSYNGSGRGGGSALFEDLHDGYPTALIL